MSARWRCRCGMHIIRPRAAYTHLQHECTTMTQHYPAHGGIHTPTTRVYHNDTTLSGPGRHTHTYNTSVPQWHNTIRPRAPYTHLQHECTTMTQHYPAQGAIHTPTTRVYNNDTTLSGPGRHTHTYNTSVQQWHNTIRPRAPYTHLQHECTTMTQHYPAQGGIHTPTTRVYHNDTTLSGPGRHTHTYNTSVPQWHNTIRPRAPYTHLQHECTTMTQHYPAQGAIHTPTTRVYNNDTTLSGPGRHTHTYNTSVQQWHNTIRPRAPYTHLQHECTTMTQHYPAQGGIHTPTTRVYNKDTTLSGPGRHTHTYNTSVQQWHNTIRPRAAYTHLQHECTTMTQHYPAQGGIHTPTTRVYNKDTTLSGPGRHTHTYNTSVQQWHNTIRPRAAYTHLQHEYGTIIHYYY